MATNFPGPCEVRLFYTCGSANFAALLHEQRLSFTPTVEPDVGDGFDVVETELRVGAPIDLESAIVAWATAVSAFYSNHATNVFTHAELWKYAAGTYDATFINTLDLSLPGLSATAFSPAAQSIVTFRTSAGGVFKLNFMESIIVPGATDPGTIANAALEAVVSDLLDGDLYPWIGRDNGFPLARLNHFPGQNEALFRQRYR